MAADIRELLINKGWGRHSCIVIDTSIKEWLCPLLTPKACELCDVDNLIIISTYDCAVINPCFDSEPWINVLIAKKIETQDKQFQNGRNERRLHFSIDFDGKELSFEVNAASIFQFERNKLLELEKHNSYIIRPDASFSLKHWLAERFRRDVWPDAFNSSIEKAEKKLKSFYKRYNLYLSGVYLELDTWDDKPKNEKYVISVIIVIEDGKLRELRNITKTKNSQLSEADNDKIDNFIKNELKTAFGDTVEWTKDTTLSIGIALDLKTEANVTLSHQRRFRRNRSPVPH